MPTILIAHKENFSAKITTNKKDIASSDLKVYNDISDVEDIEILL